jgi:hypothetical protein
MSQDEKARSRDMQCEDAGSTERGGQISGCTGAGLFFGSIGAYYVGAFLFAVWSWLALFGRARTHAAEFGLVVWMVGLVGIFHLVGLLVKPWLVCAVDTVVGWVRSLGRRARP